YRSGSIALLPIGKDGSLGEATAFDQHRGSSVSPRQDRPHAHGVAFSPDNRFALVAEHGADQVWAYRFDAAKGLLKPHDPPFGNAPRGFAPHHRVFHPREHYVYVLGELGSAISVLTFESGSMREVQSVSTLPAGFKGENTAAEIQTDRDGRFVYASNRGHDS